MSTPEPITAATPPFVSADTADTVPSCARERIFRAARELFYRHGIRGVSVDTIAAEAQTTKVTLYRVFASKDDLIVQCLEDQTRGFWQWWDAVTAPLAGRPREQIEALFESLSERVCADESERGCLIANTAVEIDDESHPAKRIIYEHSAEVTRRLRELCQAMGAARPDKLGDALTLLVEGTFASRVVFGNSERIGSVCDAALALLDSPTLGAPKR